MNNQVIEELDIIINAKVDKAKNQLKSVSNEVKKASNDIKNALKQVNKDGQLSGLEKQLDDLRKNIKDYDLTFDVNTLGLEQVEKKLDEISKMRDEIRQKGDIFNNKDDKAMLDELVYKMLDLQQAYENIRANSGDTTFVEPTPMPISTPKNSTSNVSVNLGDSVNQVKELEDEIKRLQTEAQKIEIQGLDPYKVLPLKDAFTLLKNEIQQNIPGIATLKNAMDSAMASIKASVQANLNGDYGNSLLMKLNEIKNKAIEVGSSIAQPFINAKDKLVGAFNGVKESIASKLSPITTTFKDIATVGGRVFGEVKGKISAMANDTSNPIGKLKQLINHFRDVSKEAGKTKKSSSDFGSSLGKSFTNGIKSIKKFALSLLSVRTAFSAISKASQAYLSFDTQLQDSIQNSWNVLGSLLAPVLEFVASLFSKLVSVVAKFVQALTGIDLVARANAKALNNQAKASANANKQLAGIDDINNLSSSSGNETKKMTIEDIDMTPFDSFLAKAKELLSTIFDPIVSAWENVGAGLMDSIGTTISELGALGESVFGDLFEIWTNGTGEEMITLLLQNIQSVIDIVGNLATAIRKAWDEGDSGKNIFQNIADIFNNIQKFAGLILDSINQWVVSDGFQEALSRVFDFIEDISDIAKDICDWVLDMYEKYVKPVIDEKLLPAINDIIIAVSDVWNVLKPVVDKVVQIIKNTLEPVIKGVMDFIGGIIDVIRGIAQFISGVFTGDWKKAWNGVKTIFSGIWDSLSAVIKTPLNAIIALIESLVNLIIKGFNKLIKAFNKIQIDVPDWVPSIGGKKFGFNLKEASELSIPRLASGQVAYEEQTVIVGEYANAKQDPEIISPKSMMEEAFENVISRYSNDDKESLTRLTVNVAGRTFFDDVINYINEKNSRLGISVIKEVE